MPQTSFPPATPLKEHVSFTLKGIAVMVLFLFVAYCSSHAQEVIMNQPSADVVAKGHTFVRFDEFYTQHLAVQTLVTSVNEGNTVSNVRTQDRDFYQENLNVAYGLGHNLEVSLNNTNAFNRMPMSDSLVFGFKYAPVNTKHLTLFVGDQFVQPLTNKMPGFSQGNISYEAAALKVGAWRFTGGSYQSHNGVQIGNRAGAIAGIEYMKMLTKNFGLGPGVDYASGAGSNGYTSPGLMFMYKTFFLCPGYMIANPKNPNGAHQSFVMVGYTF